MTYSDVVALVHHHPFHSSDTLCMSGYETRFHLMLVRCKGVLVGIGLIFETHPLSAAVWAAFKGL